MSEHSKKPPLQHEVRWTARGSVSIRKSSTRVADFSVVAHVRPPAAQQLKRETNPSLNSSRTTPGGTRPGDLFEITC